MKIVVLIDRYLPIIGGAQNNIHELSRRLTGQGFHVTVLTRRLERSLAPREQLDGVDVRRMGWAPGRLPSKLWCFLRFVAWLVGHRRRYDVVLCIPCIEFTDLLPAWVAHLLTGKPYVIRTTGIPEFDLALPWYRQLLTGARTQLTHVLPVPWRRVMRGSAALVAQTEFLRQSVAHHRIRRVEIIPNGVDPERFHPVDPQRREQLRRELDLPTDRVVIIGTGRFVQGKNYITLVRAVERLAATPAREKIFLLILGASERGQVESSKAELEEHVAQAGLGSMVRLLEDIANVEDYLAASDVYVMPSNYNEGMSNAVLEGMASGLAMVCSDIPQVAAMLSEEDALFFSPLDVEALAAHLQRLVDDPELRRTGGEAVVRLIRERYTNDRLSRHYAGLFREIVRQDLAPGR